MHIHWHFLKGSLTVPGSHIAHKTDFLEKSALFVAVSTCMFKGAFNYFACRQWVRNRGRPVVCKKVPRSQNAFPPRTAKPPLFLSRCWVDDIGTQVPGTGLRAWEGRIVLGVLLWRLTCALPRVPAGTQGTLLLLGYLATSENIQQRPTGIASGKRKQPAGGMEQFTHCRALISGCFPFQALPCNRDLSVHKPHSPEMQFHGSSNKPRCVCVWPEREAGSAAGLLAN